MHALTERELRQRYYELDDVHGWKVWGFLALVCGIALLVSGLDLLRYVFRLGRHVDSKPSGDVATFRQAASDPDEEFIG